MNERIRELALQAGLITEQDDRENWQEYINDVGKFVELIVRECADLYKNEDGRPWFDKFQYKEVLKIYSKQIKQHFGVEE